MFWQFVLEAQRSHFSSKEYLCRSFPPYVKPRTLRTGSLQWAMGKGVLGKLVSPQLYLDQEGRVHTSQPGGLCVVSDPGHLPARQAPCLLSYLSGLRFFLLYCTVYPDAVSEHIC